MKYVLEHRGDDLKLTKEMDITVHEDVAFISSRDYVNLDTLKIEGKTCINVDMIMTLEDVENMIGALKLTAERLKNKTNFPF